MTAVTAEGTKGNGMRDRAQTVIVGAGIVGASAAYHLAELGSTDVLVIDQGPLFETGGSTSHAPGLVFQTNGSRTMCRIAQDTVRLYGSLELDGSPGWYGVGGIEVATTPERMAELRRRQGFARSYGIADTHLLSPDEAAERIPLLDPSAILGAYLVPSDGIAKAVLIVTALAGKAAARGVSFEGGVRVTELRAEPGPDLARIAGLVALTDFASVYLALGLGLDPATSPHVADLKERMA
jgi:glycine/D-amino acid oxidase-like deaminating enzyme